MTLVSTRLEWLTRSIAADGARIDKPTNGMAIPIEVAAVDPVTYADFVAPSERQTVLALGRGEVLLARTAARIRRLDRGGELTLDGSALTVTGELSDVSTGGYEAIVAADDTSPTRAFLLARMKDRDGSRTVGRIIRREVGPETPVRIRTKGETPFMRYGDAVPPQMILKDAFGEFAARVADGGAIEVDPVWRENNIAAFRVPILGRVVCHRAIAPQLRAALRQLVSEGRSSLIDPSEYAGCYAPRFVNRDPKSSISHHSWGVALDLNSESNPFGVQGPQPKRLIEVMEAHGFTWGGRWLVPDGMHFEWATFGAG